MAILNSKSEKDYYLLSGNCIKFNKAVDRGFYQLSIKPGAFKNFLGKKRPKGRGLILTCDHDITTEKYLADEEAKTLSFEENDGYLTYQAKIPRDENLMTSMQSTVIRLSKQGLLKQVSLGMNPSVIQWDFSDEDYPKMSVIEADIIELSVLPRGAMGLDGNLDIRMSLANSENPDSNEVCNMRLLQLSEDGSYQAFNVKESIEEHKKEREELSDGDDEEDDSSTLELTDSEDEQIELSPIEIRFRDILQYLIDDMKVWLLEKLEAEIESRKTNNDETIEENLEEDSGVSEEVLEENTPSNGEDLSLDNGETSSEYLDSKDTITIAERLAMLKNEII